jgi:hypothetical protein
MLHAPVYRLFPEVLPADDTVSLNITRQKHQDTTRTSILASLGSSVVIEPFVWGVGEPCASAIARFLGKETSESSDTCRFFVSIPHER